MSTQPMTASSDHLALLRPALLLVSGLTLLAVLFLAQKPVQPSQVSAPAVVAYSADGVELGDRIFHRTCAGCHGADALGINGLGKPLIGSTFVNSRSDAEMLAFLQVGRPLNDPSNTTGVAMPAKGGNLSLTDADLLNVIAYLRFLNGAPVDDSIPAATPEPVPTTEGQTYSWGRGR